jgi:Enoyl-(Acyl carrier protein) reductase
VPLVDHHVATDRQMLFVDPVDACIRQGRVAEQAASRPGQQGMSYVRQPDARLLANLRRLRESVVASPPRDGDADRHAVDRRSPSTRPGTGAGPGARQRRHPGLIDTPLLHTAYGPERDTLVKNRATIFPGKRVGTADEVAQVILMLMTNGCMTGEVVHVDGGDRFVSQCSINLEYD